MPSNVNDSFAVLNSAFTTPSGIAGNQAKYSFSFSLHEKEYSFDTAPVFFQKNTDIFFNTVMIGDKPLNFSKTDIKVSLHCIRPDLAPVVWETVELKLVKSKSGYIYCYHGPINGTAVNRRNQFRMYVGTLGEAQIGTHSTATRVIVKDISATGIAIISSEDYEVSQIDTVHIMYKDEKVNKRLNIHAQVVRKTELPDGRFVYGCCMGEENSEIEQYIQERQRYDLKQRREMEREH